MTLELRNNASVKLFPGSTIIAVEYCIQLSESCGRVDIIMETKNGEPRSCHQSRTQLHRHSLGQYAYEATKHCGRYIVEKYRTGATYCWELFGHEVIRARLLASALFPNHSQ